MPRSRVRLLARTAIAVGIPAAEEVEYTRRILTQRRRELQLQVRELAEEERPRVRDREDALQHLADPSIFALAWGASG